MAVKSSYKNMTLCLLAICLVCSSLLAGVYALTKEPIAVAEKAKNDAAIKEVLPEEPAIVLEGTTEDGHEYLVAMKADSTVVGYVVNVAPNGFGGPIKMKVGFNAEGLVWTVKVLSHAETPGLGAKCTEPAFSSQFQKLDPNTTSLKVTKEGGSINAITASTITSRAYASGVEEAVDVYHKIKVEE